MRSLREKNRTIERIITAMQERKHFLVLGHQNPDDDCVSSMISFALVLHMFYRNVTLHFGPTVHEHFTYLLEICRYNSIPIVSGDQPVPSDIDTVVLCDTPKPSMIEASPAVRELLKSPQVLRIEIDHHLAADSAYFGDEGYRFVAEASSASELIGHILLKLEGRKDLLERHQITDLYPRNLVLAILTGIMGDSNMGQYLKSRRERKYYQIFFFHVQRHAGAADHEADELLHDERGVQRAAEAHEVRAGLLRVHDGSPQALGVHRVRRPFRGRNGADVRGVRR